MQWSCTYCRQLASTTMRANYALERSVKGISERAAGAQAMSRLRRAGRPRAARSTRTLGVAAFFRNHSNLSQRPEKCMKVHQAFVLGTVVGGMVAIGVVTAAEPETDPVKPLAATVRRSLRKQPHTSLGVPGKAGPEGTDALPSSRRRLCIL